MKLIISFIKLATVKKAVIEKLPPKKIKKIIVSEVIIAPFFKFNGYRKQISSMTGAIRIIVILFRLLLLFIDLLFINVNRIEG